MMFPTVLSQYSDTLICQQRGEDDSKLNHNATSVIHPVSCIHKEMEGFKIIDVKLQGATFYEKWIIKIIEVDNTWKV